jgi:hypothetical protein
MAHSIHGFSPAFDPQQHVLYEAGKAQIVSILSATLARCRRSATAPSAPTHMSSRWIPGHTVSTSRSRTFRAQQRYASWSRTVEAIAGCSRAMRSRQIRCPTLLLHRVLACHQAHQRPRNQTGAIVAAEFEHIALGQINITRERLTHAAGSSRGNDGCARRTTT